jgi:glyoxylase-like metal-dependent hydrolase (beta-lactamase superfamily II)
MVPDRSLILDPLATLGETAEAVTDVVLSHHHLDHTLHAALFPNARFHDFRAIYQRDRLQRRSAEGFELSRSIKLALTPRPHCPGLDSAGRHTPGHSRVHLPVVDG